MSIPRSGGAAARPLGAQLTPGEQGALAERLQGGDASAEEELVRLFSDRIAFFVRMRTRDAEAARDLTQDVLLAVVNAVRRDQLRDKERLAAFVYGTARIVTSNYLRARCKRPPEDPLDAAAEQASAGDPLGDMERAALVHRALSVLESVDRRILLLTLLEGLKPGEIAARLRLTPEVVRTRKSRALKRAAERLKALSRS